MATFDHKEIVDEIIALDGKPDPEDGPGAPIAVKVVEYTNHWGKQCWGVVYRGPDGHPLENENRYEEQTDYVQNPVVIWRAPQ